METPVKNRVFYNPAHYELNRKNRCVVCGQSTNLTRHHLIPKCYISKIYKKFKPRFKKEIHPYFYDYDFCCICVPCHEKFEIEFGEEFHKTIRNKYNVDIKKTSSGTKKGKKSRKPKPSELVVEQIKSKEDYLEFRKFCHDYFIEKMKPKLPLIS